MTIARTSVGRLIYKREEGRSVLFLCKECFGTSSTLIPLDCLLISLALLWPGFLREEEAIDLGRGGWWSGGRGRRRVESPPAASSLALPYHPGGAIPRASVIMPRDFMTPMSPPATCTGQKKGRGG